ncbi:hypothetical protein LCGC14_0628010 [marine sediment metagenome]|uniref:dATP/dGTP diphosphohydrolase N-terminal domain-containing protein n=1 Tax=marine sediment metagenome TaxID=412755 RepID=A0A0F9TPC0_9ZZZZ
MDTGKGNPVENYELRPAVRSFAEAMEARLRENDHKGGWGENKCSIAYLERRLLEEYTEYQGQVSCETGNTPEWECVDISNFAMMLYHRLHLTGSKYMQ